LLGGGKGGGNPFKKLEQSGFPWFDTRGRKRIRQKGRQREKRKCQSQRRGGSWKPLGFFRTEEKAGYNSHMDFSKKRGKETYSKGNGARYTRGGGEAIRGLIKERDMKAAKGKTFQTEVKPAAVGSLRKGKEGLGGRADEG